MKLATLPNGTPDGRLHVVSRDLARAAPAEAAETLQAALADWAAIAPALETWILKCSPPPAGATPAGLPDGLGRAESGFAAVLQEPSRSDPKRVSVLQRTSQRKIGSLRRLPGDVGDLGSTIDDASGNE